MGGRVTAVVSLALCAVLLAAATAPAAAFAGTALEVAEESAAEAYRRVHERAPQGQYPLYTFPNGSWAYAGARRWTSGFLPGGLWLEYQATGDPAWRIAAAERQRPIAAYASDTGLHDLGFMFMPAYGMTYRLTGDEAARATMVDAAQALATRFDPVVGMVRTWDTPEDFYVYNDTMINLELLFYAARSGGDPRLRDIAAQHATNTMRDFIRPDGSTYHFVAYDETTGRVVVKGQGQGYAAESTWSRGQAWMIYGLTMAFRETGDTRYLEGVRRTFDYWVSHVPADLVPYWDFDAPSIPDEPRDSSAAAVVASACMELAAIHPSSEAREAYRAYGLATLESLSGPAYLSAGRSEAVLLHGTYAAMIGAADHGTSWGDYYFLEALTRAQDRVQRVAGTNRYLTAVRASQMTFDRSRDVVICSGAGYADALSASGLAGRLDAPILLVSQDIVGAETLAEIRRLGAGRAVIVGGSAAVSERVAATLRAAGLRVERVAGRDRYATAREAARFAAEGSPEECYVVRGDDFADALALAPVAYRQGAAVLLAQPGETPWDALAAIREVRPGCVTVVGGSRGVEPRVQALISSLGVACERVAGADRFETAARLAAHACSETSATDARVVGVATGEGFADALVGGAMLGKREGVLLLAGSGSLSAPAEEFLRSRTTSDARVFVLGGEAAVSGVVETRSRWALVQ